jgi:hypothetical protein
VRCKRPWNDIVTTANPTANILLDPSEPIDSIANIPRTKDKETTIITAKKFFMSNSFMINTPVGADVSANSGLIS